jgi:hypothetical protein
VLKIRGAAGVRRSRSGNAFYPDLARILSDEPGQPKGNEISRNICVGGLPAKGGFSYAEAGIQVHSLRQDRAVSG